MKKNNKQKSNRNLYKAIVIVSVMILLIFSFMFGFALGLNDVSRCQLNPPENGEYNIDIYEGGKITVTTKIQYLQTEDDKLIIHGESVHKPIK